MPEVLDSTVEGQEGWGSTRCLRGGGGDLNDDKGRCHLKTRPAHTCSQPGALLPRAATTPARCTGTKCAGALVPHTCPHSLHARPEHCL